MGVGVEVVPVVDAVEESVTNVVVPVTEMETEVEDVSEADEGDTLVEIGGTPATTTRVEVRAQAHGTPS